MDQHGQRRIEFYDYYFGAPNIHCFVLFPVYQRKFSEGEYSNFQCESCSLGIEVIWADYGVQLKQRFPFAIAKNDPNCRTTRTISVMQNKCNGKTSCYFRVRDTDFLPSKSNCGSNRLLIVRYTCKKIPGICT